MLAGPLEGAVLPCGQDSAHSMDMVLKCLPCCLSPESRTASTPDRRIQDAGAEAG